MTKGGVHEGHECADRMERWSQRRHFELELWHPWSCIAPLKRIDLA